MKKRNFVLTSIALGLSVLTAPMMSVAETPTEVAAGQVMPSLAPMLEKVLPSVVSISVEGKQKSNAAQMDDDIPEEFKFFFGPDMFDRDRAPRNFKGLGSGAIINAEKGYVLTNNHVIKDADKITVQLHDGREFKAKVIGADEMSDVALIQVEKPKNLTALKLA